MDNFIFAVMAKDKEDAEYAYSVAFLSEDINSLEDLFNNPAVNFRRNVYTYMSLVKCDIGDIVVVTSNRDGTVALSLAIVVGTVGLLAAKGSPVANATKTSMILQKITYINYLRDRKKAEETFQRERADLIKAIELEKERVVLQQLSEPNPELFDKILHFKERYPNELLLKEKDNAPSNR